MFICVYISRRFSVSLDRSCTPSQFMITAVKHDLMLTEHASSPALRSVVATNPATDELHIDLPPFSASQAWTPAEHLRPASGARAVRCATRGARSAAAPTRSRVAWVCMCICRPAFSTLLHFQNDQSKPSDSFFFRRKRPLVCMNTHKHTHTHTHTHTLTNIHTLANTHTHIQTAHTHIPEPDETPAAEKTRVQKAPQESPSRASLPSRPARRSRS